MALGRWSRILLVTAGLAVTGAVAGAVLGAAAMGLWVWVFRATLDFNDHHFLIGAFGGAFLGGILAPIASWLLMRHVPLGRALWQTTIGTLLGAIGGLILGYFTRGDPGPIFRSALLGFAIAAIRLRFVKPAVRQPTGLEESV